jgi:phage replication O-like protein O
MNNHQQIREGYTIMPNKIEEALVTGDFSKRQLKILLVILRMSLGCQSFAMNYENNYFRLAGIYRNVIPGELKKLEAMKVIRIDREKKLIAFNFVTSEWEMIQIGNMNLEKLSALMTRVVSKQIDQKSISMTRTLHSESELTANSVLKYILNIFNKNKFKRYEKARKVQKFKEDLEFEERYGIRHSV